MNKISNIIKNKYYTYQPGEFLPIYIDGELVNKKQFHIYKLKRAVLMVRNYRLVYFHYTHHRG